MRIPAAAYPAAALAGASLGVGWDRMHAAADALEYARTGHLQPWWVPVEFAIAGAVVVAGVSRFGDPLPLARSPRRAIGELVWFTGLYAATALLWRERALLTLLLVVLLVPRLPALQRDGKANALPAFALVLGGPLLEALISAAGLFAYASPDVAGIPIWLPVLYMHAVLLAVRGTEALIWLTRRRGAPESAG